VTLSTSELLRPMQDVADEAITPGSSPRVGSGPRELPGVLVTVADHEAEDQITEALRAAYSSTRAASHRRVSACDRALVRNRRGFEAGGGAAHHRGA